MFSYRTHDTVNEVCSNTYFSELCDELYEVNIGDNITCFCEDGTINLKVIELTENSVTTKEISEDELPKFCAIPYSYPMKIKYENK